MKTLEQINTEISELKEKLKTVKGRKTEVYTRIVGYYRQVNNFNDGKRAEYKDRKNYNLTLFKDRL